MDEASAPADPYYASPRSEPLAPVLATFDGPAPQNRVTVFFRVILAIPHAICLWALGIAALIVGIIGWFGALFTGQLPGFAADFIGGVLHWQTRVYAYLFLLTDQYPPFTLGDAPYPVRIAFRPGRLNRLAVLFRIFLIIPAYIVIAVVGTGGALLAIAAWVIALFTGRLPEPLYQALAVVVRYGARFYGFLYMLTSAYPGGVFGDPPAVTAAPGFAEPGFAEPGFAEPAAQADPWRLVLSGPARTLVGLIIGLGVLGEGGVIAVDVAVIGGQISTIHQVNDAYSTLSKQVNADRTAISACGNSVSCVTGVFGSVSGPYNAFAAQLAGISIATTSESDARDTVVADARKLASEYHQLASATSADQVNSLGNSLGVNSDAQKFGSDTNAFAHALGATITTG